MKKILLIAWPFFFFNSGSRAEDNIAAIEKVISRWNDIHNDGIVSEFRNLYNYTVLFYGKNISREQCVNNKRSFLKDQYHQKIISAIRINYYTSGTIKCYFTKEVNFKETIKEYPSYVLLEKRGNNYIITGESDLVTDQDLQFQLNLGEEIGHSDNNNRILIIAFAAMTVGIISYFIFRKKKYTLTAVKTVHAASSTSPPRQEERIRYGFEKFVAERFDQNYFEIIDWQSDQFPERRNPKSNKHPDLGVRFRHGDQSIEFAVECKWRKIFYDDTILWAKPHQWDNYNAFEHTTGHSVFVVIGMGGDPGSPEDVFILPLKKINSTQLPISQLQQYKKSTNDKFFFDAKNGALM